MLGMLCRCVCAPKPKVVTEMRLPSSFSTPCAMAALALTLRAAIQDSHSRLVCGCRVDNDGRQKIAESAEEDVGAADGSLQISLTVRPAEGEAWPCASGVRSPVVFFGSQATCITPSQPIDSPTSNDTPYNVTSCLQHHSTICGRLRRASPSNPPSARTRNSPSASPCCSLHSS